METEETERNEQQQKENKGIAEHINNQEKSTEKQGKSREKR